MVTSVWNYPILALSSGPTHTCLNSHTFIYSPRINLLRELAPQFKLTSPIVIQSNCTLSPPPPPHHHIFNTYSLIKPVSAPSWAYLDNVSNYLAPDSINSRNPSEKYRQSALNRCRSSSSGHLNDIRMFVRCGFVYAICYMLYTIWCYRCYVAYAQVLYAIWP